MTVSAPWLALSVDWYLSEMFDALPELGIDEEATDGERLAWLCLLCYAKQNGRGGVVVARKSALARTFRLSERSVIGMLRRAQKCAAISVDGDSITIKNWRLYQDKAQKGQARRNTQIGKKRETVQKSATNHQPPTTKDKRQKNPPAPQGGELPFGSAEFAAAWAEWERHRAEKRAKITPTARRQQLARCAEWGEQRAIAALTHSTESGYTGLWEPRGGRPRDPENTRPSVEVKIL